MGLSGVFFSKNEALERQGKADLLIGLDSHEKSRSGMIFMVR